MSIKDLVEKYHVGRANYLKADYNETQLRIDFLDPLFELLGWDLKNNQGKATNEREVLVEEGLREDFDSNTKKPDYTFRLFAERKFFLEAKKPHVKIDIDPIPAKQIRRYGFTAKLKISVLSNFEYLAIYDCSQIVNIGDPATTARIRLYHYTEYEAAFDDIKRQLGHESVYDGTFDETWKDIERQLKLYGVDDLFLKQINEWRLILGQEIWYHEKQLDEIQLNDIVQSYINSIIFLRVCEDRNLEVYKTLLNFANGENFTALIQLFHTADRKYNAGLFNHPLTTEIITNNRSAFWTIIKHLYFPESVYSFVVFSSDILGNIYEIFLGEQLRIKEDQIILEKKPEHIDRDIVTTPTFIIWDILKETVAKNCEGKTDIEIFNSSFADIACGSGAFLLETYQLLHDTLVDYYLANNPEELQQTGVNTFKLKFEAKKKIITNCIFGVDKDYSAVEACKFGLLLKLLENEDHNTIPTPALPNLNDNIYYGNSLLDSTTTSAENETIINPYNFGDRKFDVIIGNPPYMATEHMKQLTPLELPLYKINYSSAYKQFDKYFLFIQRGFELLKPNGQLGYIAPSKLAKVGAAKRLRELLVSNKAIAKIVGFGANQIFEDKTTYTCLLFIKNAEQNHLKYLEIHSLKDWRTRNISPEDYDNIEFDKLDNDGWVLVPGNLKPAFELIENQSQTLETLIGSENIYNGIQTSANNIYIQTATNTDEHYHYFQKDGMEWKIEKKLTRPYYKTSNGADNLNTYRPFSPNAFVIYPYLKIDNNIRFVSIEEIELEYPYTYAFLNHYSDVLKNPKRDIKPKPETENEWYRYGRHQSLDKCDVPAKIIVGVLSQGNKYAIDYYSTLISSGGTAGYCMITLPDDLQYSIYYIQALLNSKYLEWFSALHGEVFRGGYIARGTKVLKKLPIRIINFENVEEKTLHDNIAATQKTLIHLQGEIDKKMGNMRELTPLNRQFENNKNKLNTDLKTLYNLGEHDNLIPLISKLYAAN
ncbi:N-6 DNA methylase [Sphingobacterium faecium]|uniref:Eco57I restriction-modification methylase domain-containing protein n=1 Tax=Sphingobacterium faecium TaxID=34087 RepID=UPI0032079E99